MTPRGLIFSVAVQDGAPFPLLAWEDTQVVLRDRPRFEFMKSAVQSGFMPYNVQANPPVERLTDPREANNRRLGDRGRVADAVRSRRGGQQFCG